MVSQGKAVINNNQFRALIVCTMWPTVINYGSGMVARQVGRDMWLSGIISVLCTAVFISFIVIIGRSFPGKTIIEYGQELLWTIPGKVLGLLLSVYFFVAAANTINVYPPPYRLSTARNTLSGSDNTSCGCNIISCIKRT